MDADILELLMIQLVSAVKGRTAFPNNSFLIHLHCRKKPGIGSAPSKKENWQLEG